MWQHPAFAQIKLQASFYLHPSRKNVTSQKFAVDKFVGH